MSRLLRANFSRLWKTKAFWVCLILPVAFSIFLNIIDNIEEIYNSMMNVTPISLFFAAIFTAMYIGTDNSEKTVRNKLIIGIPRGKVYLANLITVSVGMALIFAANWLTVLVYDLTHGGYLKIGTGALVLYMALGIVAGAAMIALCTLLTMLITSRSLATAITIMLTIGMFFGTRFLAELSTGPSHYTSSVYDYETGEYVMVDDYDDYTFVVSEGVEKAAKAVYKFLPTSQLEDIETEISFLDMRLGVGDITSVFEPVWYSLGVGAAATVIGLLAFRKKDLK